MEDDAAFTDLLDRLKEATDETCPIVDCLILDSLDAGVGTLGEVHPNLQESFRTLFNTDVFKGTCYDTSGEVNGNCTFGEDYKVIGYATGEIKLSSHPYEGVKTEYVKVTLNLRYFSAYNADGCDFSVQNDEWTVTWTCSYLSLDGESSRIDARIEDAISEYIMGFGGPMYNYIIFETRYPLGKDYSSMYQFTDRAIPAPEEVECVSAGSAVAAVAVPVIPGKKSSDDDSSSDDVSSSSSVELAGT